MPVHAVRAIAAIFSWNSFRTTALTANELEIAFGPLPSVIPKVPQKHLSDRWVCSASRDPIGISHRDIASTHHTITVAVPSMDNRDAHICHLHVPIMLGKHVHMDGGNINYE